MTAKTSIASHSRLIFEMGRITIITSTLNCAMSLAATAASIRGQTHRAVQWIVVDGASTDGTLKVIQRNADIISHWISEVDGGIYDAWNKACRFIDGDWVLFLGAGDTLCTTETLSQVAERVASLPSTALIAYGNVVQRIAGDALYRFGKVDLGSWELYRPALPPHQGTFHRASLLQHQRPFDTSYRVVGDGKLLLQVIRPEVTHYLGIDVADMEPGGIASHPASCLKVMREFLRLENEIGYRIPFWRRSWFIVRSYMKYALFLATGRRAVANVAVLKRRFVGRSD